MKSAKSAFLACLICLGIVALPPAQANADPMPLPGQADTGWRYSLSLKAFTPLSTRGESTVGGRTVDVDLDLRDVLDLLDSAGEVRFEVWNGDFGLIVDANYVSIGADGPFPAPAGATYAVNTRQKWLALLAAYRVYDGTYGANNQRFTFDLQAGARYNSLRQTIKLYAPGPGALPTVGGTESWWEPVIGARGKWRLNDKWATVAALELGGFGAGGNDLQVSANLGFDFRPWEKTSITFGYRYFSVDFSSTLPSGAFAYDVTQHGPYVGVVFHFD